MGYVVEITLEIDLAFNSALTIVVWALTSYLILVSCSFSSVK